MASNQEILETAITKAIDNGWDKWRGSKWGIADGDSLTPLKVYVDKLAGYQVFIDPEAIIFNRDFAKALWGLSIDDATRKNNWLYHLQNMVIADDPIAYLGDHL